MRTVTRRLARVESFIVYVTNKAGYICDYRMQGPSGQEIDITPYVKEAMVFDSIADIGNIYRLFPFDKFDVYRVHCKFVVENGPAIVFDKYADEGLTK